MESDQGQKTKRPYAIAMKHGGPFGLAGIWENWKELVDRASRSSRVTQ